MSEQNFDNAPAKPPFWRDPEKRALVFQAVFLAFVIFVGYSLVQNTMNNLASQGIASGFGFLKSNTGFAIAETLIDYDERSTYFDAFIVGLLNTILVSVIGIFFATILGFVVGIARLSKNWLVAKLAAFYVEILRNVPLLLQLFFWYFAVLRDLPNPRNAEEFVFSIYLTIRGLFMPKPILEDGFGFIVAAIIIVVVGIIVLAKWAKKRQEATGEQFPVFWTSVAALFVVPFLVAMITGFPMSWDYPVLTGFNFRGGMVLTPEFAALVFSLSIYTSAFIAEIVRSGISAVDKGQTEASSSLGLKPSLTTRLVVVPQALRVIIPPLTSQYLNLTKNSSLAAAIGYPELVSVFAGTSLNQAGQAVEIMGMTLAVYLFLSLTISFFMNWYNKRMALVER